MKISLEQLNQNLSYLYRLYDDSLKARSVIKNWCITVWSGIIIIIITDKISSSLDINKYLIIIILPLIVILFFWFLEAIEGARTRLFKEQIIRLENGIANKQLNFKETKDVFPMSGYNEIGKGKKINYFYRSIFFNETLTLFYFILSLASALFFLFMSYRI